MYTGRTQDAQGSSNLNVYCLGRV